VTDVRNSPARRHVLISIMSGYDFGEMLREAFASLGWTGELAFFHEQGSRRGWLNYVSRPYAIVTGEAATFAREKRRCLADIFRKVEATRPSVFFCVRADWLDPEAIERIRALSPGIKIAIWMYDPVEQFPQGLAAAALADRMYLYDTDDIETYRRLTGHEAQRLDLAYSPKRFTPLDGVAQNIDVSMTGSFGMGSYDQRIATAITLGKLARTHGFSLAVTGPMWTTWNPLAVATRRAVARRHPGFLEIFRNRMLPYRDQNELYNRSKINVNVHRIESAGSCNTRVFEILGAGGFQLCNDNPIVIEHFRPGEHLDMFRSEGDLEDKLLYYLNHAAERRAIARRGHETVAQSHRFSDRMQSVLDDLFARPGLPRVGRADEETT
jgi:spore maturation protein CgeB